MKKICLFLINVTFTFFAFSQQQLKISGKIIDASSKGIAGASVRLLNTSTGTVTDQNGFFTLPNVDPGSLTIQVSANGYADFSRLLNTSTGNSPMSIQLQLSPKMLDQVIVTAQKTEELLQEVPNSITAISARQVEEYQLWNSKDLSAIVPNLYTADPGDRRNVSSIRGIATTSYDPAVATYIDGVNQFSLDTYIAQLFDVERIEILRGAQGTLYGRNATAGVINIITRQPSNKASGFAEITNGNAGLQRYSAGFRAPLIKNKLYFGMAALYDKSNGFYTNQYNNLSFDKQNSFTGNYYVKYLPTDKWAITLNVKHNNNRNKGAFPLVSSIEDALKDPFLLSQNAVSNMTDNIFNASLSANHFGKKVSFSSQTAYQSNYRFYDTPMDADFSPIDGITLINNYGKDWNKVKVLSQEFKFSSPAASTTAFKWTAGAYFFHQDNPTKQAIHFGEDAAMVGSPDKNFSLINSAKAISNGMSLFAQGTYALTSKLNLTAGIRYDREKKEQSILGQYQMDPDPTPIFDFRSDTSASAVFHSVSPKLSASYALCNNNLLFANYSKGFRAGGLTPLSSDPSQPALFAYQPEYSNNYEIGIKNNFLNNRLLVNITAFYSAVNDAQVPTLILPDAVTITKNTGKLTSKGIELETRALLNGFQLDYNLGYTDANFKNLKLAQYGAEADLAGKKQLFTPDVTSMMAAQYGCTLSQKHLLKITFRGEWKYIGKQFFDLANTVSQLSYNLLNASIGISAPGWSLKFWGRNLTNKNYVSYGYDFGAVRLGDPKTYGITLGVKL
jgi:iron complex outermembrane recepter protein